MGLLTSIRDSITHVTDRLFSEGEPKRIGIYGPPNAGKCLAPDETIVLADGSTYRIADLFDMVEDTGGTNVSDDPNESWIECDIDLHVPSVTADLTVTAAPVSHVFRQRYTGQLFRVGTRNGRTVTVSPRHPFLAETNAGHAYVSAAMLSEGQHVGSVPAANRRVVGQPVATDGGTTSQSVRGPNPAGRQIRGKEGSVSWDTVTSIERVDYDGYIYDLTVPEHHTFVTADGLVVHNTTLANRIARDWTGDAIGPESHVPHETRRARRKENVEIKRNGNSVSIDIVDTPGVTTKVDYQEFLEFDIDEEDAIRRSREATEGVAEAMHWLREDIDGVIYVLDSAEDPFTQVNTMLIGIIESRDLPVLIFANKIDLDDSSVQPISNAFPQHETVPLSALEGENMDEVYDKIAEYFG